METGANGAIHFLNVEYFFRLLYESRLSTSNPDIDFWSAFSVWFSHAWGVLGVISFLFAIIAFGIIVYASVRMKQIHHHEEHEKYSTLSPEVAEKQKDHHRWAHIQALVESASESDWRQAIIEADIMLEEVLTQAGYPGAGVGEKLKFARFKSLDDAWEAHKLRNEIAHQGSAFHLSDKAAFQAIKRYETVFKEFGEI